VLNRIAIVSFGDREEWYAQAHLAILTALAWLPAPAEVVITTDRPDWYAWFDDRVRIVSLTPERIAEWSGPQRFIWRVVLKALAETALRDPPANLLYLDVDTLTRKPLGDLVAALGAGDVFLDRFEAPLHRRGGCHRVLWNQVRGRTFAGFGIDERTALWNSGVVAVGAANRELPSRALELCDAITAAGVQSRLVEQLSQSMILESTGRLREARGWIDHYWGNKAGYNESIREQLATVLMRRMDVEAAIDYVREHPILRPLRIKPRWWHRHLRRLAGAQR
jgi:hypothetical protein